MKRLIGYVLLSLAVCAACYLVFGLDGLRPVLGLALFGAWSAGIAWKAYRTGLDAGYRQSVSMPPIDKKNYQDMWDTIKEGLGEEFMERTEQDEQEERTQYSGTPLNL